MVATNWMTPVDVCAMDTTAETWMDQGSSGSSATGRVTCVRKASTGSSVHSPLLVPFEVTEYGCDREKPSRPRVLGGSVPASWLAGVAALSLGAVAVLAVIAGSRARGNMAKAHDMSSHPRQSQLMAVPQVTAHLEARTGNEPALLGVDVVAYRFLSEGADPIFGSEDFTYTLETPDIDSANLFETTFWFSSAANRDLFASNPSKYAPRFGGFCSFGITSEFSSGWNRSMDDADATQGWPWTRNHLGPPSDLRVWTIQNDRLYFAFLPDVLDVFKANYNELSAVGEQRWQEWFGNAEVAGPFNVQCMAEGYGPPVERTCTYKPQDSYRVLTPKTSVIESECNVDLKSACGDLQGNDPVRNNACSSCLDAHYYLLKNSCPTSNGALQAYVDKVFCW